MLNEIYNRQILDLAGNILRQGRLPAPDATAKAHSKLCGSTVIVDLVMDDGKVVDVAHLRGDARLRQSDRGGWRRWLGWRQGRNGNSRLKACAMTSPALYSLSEP